MACAYDICVCAFIYIHTKLLEKCLDYTLTHNKICFMSKWRVG